MARVMKIETALLLFKVAAALSAVLSVFCGILVGITYATDQGTKIRYALGITSMSASAILGLMGAKTHNEIFVRVFFVCQIWGLAVLSQLVIGGFDVNSYQVCMSRADLIVQDGCSAAAMIANAEIACAFLCMALQLAGAYVGLELWDRMNEKELQQGIQTVLGAATTNLGEERNESLKANLEANLEANYKASE